MFYHSDREVTKADPKERFLFLLAGQDTVIGTWSPSMFKAYKRARVDLGTDYKVWLAGRIRSYQ